MTSVLFTLLFCMAAVPRRGKILPVDKAISEAYELIQLSETGRNLVKLVAKEADGILIYLTLGTTERDRLFDFRGEAVRGVTRAGFQFYGDIMYPRGVTVITNRDLTGSDPLKIVRSLAFELENVRYSFSHPYPAYGSDSPYARLAQKIIIDELGLDENREFTRRHELYTYSY